MFVANALSIDHSYSPGYIGRLPLAPMGDLAPYDLTEQFPDIDFIEGFEDFDKVLAERSGADPDHAHVGRITLSKAVVAAGDYTVRSMLRRSPDAKHAAHGAGKLEAFNYIERGDGKLYGHWHAFMVAPGARTLEDDPLPFTRRQAGLILALSDIALARL